MALLPTDKSFNHSGASFRYLNGSTCCFAGLPDGKASYQRRPPPGFFWNGGA